MQFDPKEVDRNDKTARDIVVQQSGFGPFAVRVNATVWPSHEHIAINKGDVVTLEGKYNYNKTTNNEGEERVYHNLSVFRMKNHGPIDEGNRDPRAATSTSSSSTPDVTDEDIPF